MTTLKHLINMYLSPDWVYFLKQQGFDAVHWSSVGDPCAEDTVLMRYAVEHDLIVFTHDVDFGNLLAATNASRLSVIQVRTQEPVMSRIGDLVIAGLRQFHNVLYSGSLIVISEERQRARILPIRPSPDKQTSSG